MSEVFRLAPHEWAQLRLLLDEALALPVPERQAWLRALPVDRAGALRPHLASMLATAAAAAGSDAPATAARLLDTLPKVETAQFAPPPGSGEQVGDSAGPYRLLRELGSGGMGSVWLAERTDVLQGRQVALKLPHGAWKRAGLAERLARERAILATLEHPNIARLYDAGVTPDGRPWLALEYVDGERIDTWCQGRQLPLSARVALFLQVARAVAYAHAQLVVHRDLKPANILVTGAGEVKLLDFGIAKLAAEGVAEETELTREAGRAFTPEYASPEQILGRPLGTASDVYSLGVVLFELLAGVRPYRLQRHSRAALEEAVAAAEVPRPSSLAPAERRAAIRGDLDTIVLKALRREPAGRYATVAALADDLQRHLDQRPVLAQPDSAWYRLRKFGRRNRLAVLAGTVAAAGLLAGSGVAVWQAVQARTERDQALLQQRRASSFAEFMRMLLQDAGRPDQPLTPAQMLDRGVAMLERRAQHDDALAAHMWHELSRNYLLFQNTERELALLERSVAAAQRIGDFDQLAAGQCSIAWSLLMRDRAAALARLQAGRDALQQSGRPTDMARLNCARAESRRLQFEARMPEAIALLEAERERAQQRGDTLLWDGLLRASLIDLYLVADRAGDALPLAEAALKELRDAGRQGSLAELVGISALSGTYMRLGEHRRAAEVSAELVAWIRRPGMLETAPMGLLTWAAAPLLRLGRHAEALELTELDGPMVLKSGNPSTIGLRHLARARALTGLGQLDAAGGELDLAEAQWSVANRGHARFLQEAAMDRAELQLLRGDVAGARALLGAVLAGLGYPGSTAAPGIDRLLRLAARIELAAARPALAAPFAADALAAARRQARGDDSSADVGLARLLRAEALVLMGRPADALQEARRRAGAAERTRRIARRQPTRAGAGRPAGGRGADMSASRLRIEPWPTIRATWPSSPTWCSASSGSA